MVYISGGGTVTAKRSLFRLTIFSEIFWGILNFFYFFFASMFSPGSQAKKAAGGGTDYRRPGGGGSNGKGNINGFKRQNAPGAPPMGGG